MQAYSPLKKHPHIRPLPTHLVNQIAAGEVIERPASALKELVENALDAGATDIQIQIRSGGKSLISIIDNGCGMSREELSLAVERHTTSKLPEDDLWDIHTFGFRGEALPSIGSVSRLSISSRLPTSETGWIIRVEGGRLEDPTPISQDVGTRVEIKDLFFATPARLKFLKTDQTESQHILETLSRISMAHPNVAFSLKDENKSLLNLRRVLPQHDQNNAVFERIRDVMPVEFRENSLEVIAEREEMRLLGLVSLPTLARGSASHQYFFVNHRPIKDRLLHALVRESYQDLLAPGRFPLVSLFLDVPADLVDVNVHPAKSEVRFREQGLIRGLVLGALKDVLRTAGHRTSTTIAQTALGAFQPMQMSFGTPRRAAQPSVSPWYPAAAESASAPSYTSLSAREEGLDYDVRPSVTPIESSENPIPPLGWARAQLHETYIVAQTTEGLILVDQHAAHERLVYERLKTQSLGEGVTRQALLIPEVVSLKRTERDILLSHQPSLETLGILIEPFGDEAILVRETPALLGNVAINALVLDLVDHITENENPNLLEERLCEVLSSAACHGSVRAGKIMAISEMNALLRQMESTNYSGQCNHGRPTYIELKLTDIEKLFGRR